MSPPLPLKASVRAYATEQYSNARTEELSLQRKELMNNVAAVTWAAFGISFVAVDPVRLSLDESAGHSS